MTVAGGREHLLPRGDTMGENSDSIRGCTTAGKAACNLLFTISSSSLCCFLTFS